VKKLLFRVNHNPNNIDIDHYHDFRAIGKMRDYIDDNFGEPMDIEVWDGEENLIVKPYGVYWVNDNHPTFKQLVAG
jgi:hypothetical protein